MAVLLLRKTRHLQIWISGRLANAFTTAIGLAKVTSKPEG